jgi:hypothetical protein
LLSGTTSPARYDASPRRLGSRVHPEPAGARAADRGPAVTQRAESAEVGCLLPALVSRGGPTTRFTSSSVRGPGRRDVESRAQAQAVVGPPLAASVRVLRARE